MNRKINALILDDEIGAVKALNNMLEAYCPDIKVLCATVSTTEALSAVRNMKPDLVFLDVEMSPGYSGFDFLQACSRIEFGVIFVTAYPKYAVKAINTVNPVAYLVKPFSASELMEAVQGAITRLLEKERDPIQAAGQTGIILNDSRHGRRVLLANQIVFCKAEGNFTEFYLHINQKEEKVVASGNLGFFESQLPELIFCRTHHSYLVNLSQVNNIKRKGRGGQIRFNTINQVAEVSVAKMESVNRRLSAFYQMISHFQNSYNEQESMKQPSDPSKPFESFL